MRNSSPDSSHLSLGEEMEDPRNRSFPGTKKRGIGCPYQRRGQIKDKIFKELQASITSAFNSVKLSVTEHFTTPNYPVRTGTGNPYPRRGQILKKIMKDILAVFHLILGLSYF